MTFLNDPGSGDAVTSHQHAASRRDGPARVAPSLARPRSGRLGAGEEGSVPLGWRAPEVHSLPGRCGRSPRGAAPGRRASGVEWSGVEWSECARCRTKRRHMIHTRTYNALLPHATSLGGSHVTVVITCTCAMRIALHTTLKILHNTRITRRQTSRCRYPVHPSRRTRHCLHCNFWLLQLLLSLHPRLFTPSIMIAIAIAMMTRHEVGGGLLASWSGGRRRPWRPFARSSWLGPRSPRSQRLDRPRALRKPTENPREASLRRRARRSARARIPGRPRASGARQGPLDGAETSGLAGRRGCAGRRGAWAALPSTPRRFPISELGVSLPLLAGKGTSGRCSSATSPERTARSLSPMERAADGGKSECSAQVARAEAAAAAVAARKVPPLHPERETAECRARDFPAPRALWTLLAAPLGLSPQVSAAAGPAGPEFTRPGGVEKHHGA